MTLEIKALSLQMAKKIGDSAEQAAVKNKIFIAIAIMDSHGNLKYYRRMDNDHDIQLRI